MLRPYSLMKSFLPHSIKLFANSKLQGEYQRVIFELSTLCKYYTVSPEYLSSLPGAVAYESEPLIWDNHKSEYDHSWMKYLMYRNPDSQFFPNIHYTYIIMRSDRFSYTGVCFIFRENVHWISQFWCIKYTFLWIKLDPKPQ